MPRSTLTDDAAQVERGIREANEAVLAAQAILEVRIIAAREQRYSWSTIGRGLNVSRQSAQERYSKLPEIAKLDVR